MRNLEIFNYIILGSASLTAVVVLTPLMRMLARNINFVDLPKAPHKSHSKPVPYLGGAAIVISVLSTVFVSLALRGTNDEIETGVLTLTPSLIMAFVGLIDDKFELKPMTRFIVQTSMAVGVTIFIVSRGELGNPTGITNLDILISIIWIVGITNSINFFDNIDGGATGTVAFISVGIFLISISNGQYLISAMAVVLVSASIGFLIWNKAPASIYMGDTGALFLGFLLAILTIRLDTNSSSIFISFLVPVLLLAVPILDTTVAVLSRIRRRISPFMGGQDHISHRLLRLGLSKKITVYSLWLGTLLYCGLAVFLALGILNESFVASFGAISWLALLIFFLNTADEVF